MQDRKQISNRTEAFHSRFDQIFDYFTVKWDWEREFLKMERQVSVGPDRPVEEDHLWRWTTFSRKFPRGPKLSIYASTEISGNISNGKYLLFHHFSLRQVSGMHFSSPNPRGAGRATSHESNSEIYIFALYIRFLTRVIFYTLHKVQVVMTCFFVN